MASAVVPDEDPSSIEATTLPSPLDEVNLVAPADVAPGDGTALSSEALARERDMIREERWLAKEQTAREEAQAMRLRFEQRNKTDSPNPESSSSLSRWLQEEVLSKHPTAPAASAGGSRMTPTFQVGGSSGSGSSTATSSSPARPTGGALRPPFISAATGPSFPGSHPLSLGLGGGGRGPNASSSSRWLRWSGGLGQGPGGAPWAPGGGGHSSGGSKARPGLLGLSGQAPKVPSPPWLHKDDSSRESQEATAALIQQAGGQLPYEYLLRQRQQLLDGDDAPKARQSCDPSAEHELLSQGTVGVGGTSSSAGAAAGAAVAASSSSSKEIRGQEYLLDNSRLQADAPGVTLRFSKRLEDRDEESPLVPWNVVVEGYEEGDGWLRVGDDRYLPMDIAGHPILTPYVAEQKRQTAEAQQSKGDAAVALTAGHEEEEEEKDAADEDNEHGPKVPLTAMDKLRRKWREASNKQLEEILKAVEERQREELTKEAEESLEKKRAELAEARKQLEQELASRRAQRAAERAQAQGSEQQNHYKTLGIDRYASPEEISKAYKTLAKQVHPDKLEGGADEELRLQQRGKMADLTLAYKVLCSPRQRWNYDRTLNEPTFKSDIPGPNCVSGGAVSSTAKAKVPPIVEVADFDWSQATAPYWMAHGRASRVCSTAGAQRKEQLRLALAQLRGQQDMKLGLLDEDMERYNREVVRHIGPYSPFRGMGESGRSHRLAMLDLRPKFRDTIVRHVSESSTLLADAKARGGLQVVCLAPLEALFELELLERLRLKTGLTLAKICLVDPAYRRPDASTRRALREFADWQRCAAQLLNHSPCEVFVFGSLMEFAKATEADGPAAKSHLFVHCEARWKGSSKDAQRLAKRSLIGGGLLFRLAEEKEWCETTEELALGDADGSSVEPFYGDSQSDAGTSEDESAWSLDSVLNASQSDFSMFGWTLQATPNSVSATSEDAILLSLDGLGLSPPRA